MKVSLISSSHPEYKIKKEDANIFSGHLAGICYMPNDFESLLNEPKEKTTKRINSSIANGHHSVCGHITITLYLEDVPKAMALVLNNEKEYNTSEKSARYTKMQLTEQEQTLYDKWYNKFIELITNKYQDSCPTYFTDSRIKKLAQENARYLTSVFTPCSMAYTTSYRQLNYLCNFFKQEIDANGSNEFYKRLLPFFKEFCTAIEDLNLTQENLNTNAKGWQLSLIKNDNIPVEEYFGDVYATNYKCTYASFAHIHRHRSINYTISLLDNNEFYTPEILKENNLEEEWQADAKNINDGFLQGNLISVNEMSTITNFERKLQERLCTCAQLETNKLCSNILNKYVSALEEKNHPYAKRLKAYTKGSRCLNGFKCNTPCAFLEGINGTRII